MVLLLITSLGFPTSYSLAVEGNSPLATKGRLETKTPESGIEDVSLLDTPEFGNQHQIHFLHGKLALCPLDVCSGNQIIRAFHALKYLTASSFKSEPPTCLILKEEI